MPVPHFLKIRALIIRDTKSRMKIFDYAIHKAATQMHKWQLNRQIEFWRKSHFTAYADTLDFEIKKISVSVGKSLHQLVGQMPIKKQPVPRFRQYIEDRAGFDKRIGLRIIDLPVHFSVLVDFGILQGWAQVKQIGGEMFTR